MQAARARRYVIERKDNIVLVDFRRPDPPAPDFPGAGALRSESAGTNEPSIWSVENSSRQVALSSIPAAQLCCA